MSPSTLECPGEMQIGTRLPEPFSKLVIVELLRVTERGWRLYRLERVEKTEDEEKSE